MGSVDRKISGITNGGYDTDGKPERPAHNRCGGRPGRGAKPSTRTVTQRSSRLIDAEPGLDAALEPNLHRAVHEASREGERSDADADGEPTAPEAGAWFSRETLSSILINGMLTGVMRTTGGAII